MHTCGICNRQFLQKNSLSQHSQATDHAWCGVCAKPFKSAQALQDHINNSSAHVDEFRCLPCGRNFVSLRALDDHLRDKVHSRQPRKQPQPQQTPRCKPCDRTFASDVALERHRASLVHRPISANLTCIGPGCNQSFAAPSAMMHHLESGGCSSGLTKRAIDRAVFTHDTDEIICHGAAVLTITGASASASASKYSDTSTTTTPSGILTPTTSDSGYSGYSDYSGGGVPLTPRTSRSNSIASISTTNGALTPTRTPTPTTSTLGSSLLLQQQLRCPHCPSDRPPFAHLHGLRMHLASPAHAPKIYHCPAGLLAGFSLRSKKKGREFTTLSGLVQHLEAGVCAGGGAEGKRMFRAAVRLVAERLREVGLGEVRLVG